MEGISDDAEALGRWQNILTGKEYCDSASQTCIRKHINGATSQVTQTLATSACKYTTMCHDRITQTSAMPDLEDKLVTPSSAARNPMTSELRRKAEELFCTTKFSRLEEESAIKIQKCYRACRARREISSLARFAVITRTHPPVSEKLVRLGQDKRFKIIDQRPPRSRADFEMLRNVLDRWRIMENQRVDRSLFGSSRIAAKSMILLKEIELLRSIELAKSRIRNERRERESLEYLDQLAMPETWSTRDGKMIEVETLRVLRARECRSLYLSLANETCPRIDALKKIKIYIQGHTCDAARELDYVLDQELEFCSRNLQTGMMNQLRCRVKLALFRFICTTCEPSSTGERSISAICTRCGKLLPMIYFTNYESLPTCDTCVLLRPSKDPKILYEPYEQMLKELRKSEAQMGSLDSLAFHVGPNVLHHLVNYIWHGKSGISEFDDLFQLRLLRFRMDLEWSPWNSVLLTKREAAVHQAMTNPWDLYDGSLVKKFVLRNLQAKLYFNSRKLK